MGAVDLGRASTGPVRATVSVGVAQLIPGVTEVKPLLDLADQALYRAKARGRDTVSD